MTDIAETKRRHAEGSIAPLKAGDPEEITFWEHLVPRELSDEDRSRFEGNVAEIFSAFGMDLDPPGTKESFWRGTYEEEAGLRDEFLLAAGHR